MTDRISAARRAILAVVAVLAAPAIAPGQVGPIVPGQPRREVVKTDAEWRQQLTPMQYYVTRQKGTEQPFTGKYLRSKSKGIFACVCCEAELFSSQHKYNSGTGWPSFWRPIRAEALEREWDYSGLEPRVEVLCHSCGAHLGHVFPDGPRPTGLRFCINSAALVLKAPRPPEAETQAEAEAEAVPAESVQPEGEPATGDAPAPEADAPRPTDRE